jgi:two-component system, sensor histidine kinase PdtaS
MTKCRNLRICLTFCIAICISITQAKANSIKLTEERTGELNIQFHNALSLAISITNGQKSLSYSLEALQIASELEDDDKIAQSFNEISHDYEKLGDFSNSLYYVIMAAKKYEKIGKKEGIGMAYNRIGSIYLLQGNRDLAISYMKKALKIHKETGLFDSYADDLNNLGEIYRLNNQYRFALQNFTEANAFFRQNNDSINIAYVTGNIGLVYAAQNLMDSANYYLSTATAILNQKKDYYPIAVYLIETAKIYLKQGNINEALEKALEALNISERENFKEQNRDANKLLSDIYAWGNNYKKAFSALNEYYKAKDSISNSKIVGDMAEIRADYEVSKKESEIKGLQTINSLRNRINIGLGICFLLATILTVILVRFNKKIKFTNRLLSLQKTELEQKNEIIRISLIEKETLLKEIHHRVKNNLQILSSLLNLQSQNVKNKKAIEALSESQQRLHSIALVHQKLYQNDNLAKINVKEYLEDLVETIHLSFYSKEKSVSYRLNIADVNLDVDTVVPLGLILNELVTNAYKYAFNKANDGALSIDLNKEDEHLYLLIVKDNGPGLPENLNIDETESLGLKLVSILVKQLEGTINVKSNNGAEFNINFIDVIQSKI